MSDTGSSTLEALTSVGTGSFPYVDQDLDFTSGALSGLITFTRATTAWGFNSAGVLAQSAINAPVFEYRYNAASGVWQPAGLRVEDSRTNILFPSGNLAGTGWSTANIGSRTANAAVSPDGTTTATLLDDTSVVAAQYTDKTFTIPGTDTNWYTWSLYVKAGTSDLCHLRTYMLGGTTALSTGVGVNFTFSTKATTVSGTSGAGAATAADAGFTEVGNGWYRVWVRIQNNNTGNITVYGRIYPQNTSLAAVGTIYAWGGQIELGSVPSSYIPTTTVAVTRSPDSPIISSVPWINPAAGTFAVEYNLPAIAATTLLQTAFSVDDATSNERYSLRASSGVLNAVVVDGAVTQASVSMGSLTAGTTARTSFAYALNDIAASLNGAAVVTDTVATLPTVTRATFGLRLTSSDCLTGYVRRFQYSPVRKTNAELQVLSLATVTSGVASTLAALTSSASGSTVIGTAAGTLEDLTSSASGSTVTGTAAGTLEALTSSGTGAQGAAGTGASTLEDLTSSGTGAQGAAGTGASTLEDLTGAASGLHYIGTAASTLEDLTGAASGLWIEPVTGTASTPLDDLLAVSATGAFLAYGAVTTSLDDLAQSVDAGAYEFIIGTPDIYLVSATSSASGTAFQAGAGASAITLAALTSAASGGSTGGAAAIILGDLTGSAAGVFRVSGAAAGTLVDLGSYGFGTAYRARRVRQLDLIGSTRATVTLHATVRQ